MGQGTSQHVTTEKTKSRGEASALGGVFQGLLRRGTHGLVTREPWRGGIYCKDAAGEAQPIQSFDCSLQIRNILEFHETEPSGVTGDAIAYHLCECNGVALLLEPLSKLCFTTRVGYIPNKQSQHRF
jgi:hypothetical protein